MLSNGKTKASDLTDSMKWIMQNEKSSTFGNADVNQIAAAGQCYGGIRGEVLAIGIAALISDLSYEQRTQHLLRSRESRRLFCFIVVISIAPPRLRPC